MHSLKSTLAWLALGAVIMTPMAHAQLLLTGKVTGNFTDTPGPNTTIFNAPDGSSAWLKSGIPQHAWDKQTAIEFTQKNFTDLGPGLVATDLFKVTNGRTLLYSTAKEAHFDLWLTLTSPVSHSTLLTAIAFTIENTPNGPDPQSVDDNYTITAGEIAPFKVENTWVQFTFVAPESFSIEENDHTYVGDLYVSFVPVPEPSTYGMIGAALLTGLIGFRAMRRRNAAAAA